MAFVTTYGASNSKRQMNQTANEEQILLDTVDNPFQGKPHEDLCNTEDKIITVLDIDSPACGSIRTEESRNGNITDYFIDEPPAK